MPEEKPFPITIDKPLCRFCRNSRNMAEEENADIRIRCSRGLGFRIEVNIDGAEDDGDTTHVSLSTISQEISFCPMCGRKLIS